MRENYIGIVLIVNVDNLFYGSCLVIFFRMLCMNEFLVKYKKFFLVLKIGL